MCDSSPTGPNMKHNTSECLVGILRRKPSMNRYLQLPLIEVLERVNSQHN